VKNIKKEVIDLISNIYFCNREIEGRKEKIIQALKSTENIRLYLRLLKDLKQINLKKRLLFEIKSIKTDNHAIFTNRYTGYLKKL